MQDAVLVRRMRMKSYVHQRGGPWKILDCLSFGHSVHFFPGANPFHKKWIKKKKRY